MSRSANWTLDEAVGDLRKVRALTFPRGNQAPKPKSEHVIFESS